MSEFTIDEQEIQRKVLRRLEVWQHIGEELIKKYVSDSGNDAFYLNEGILYLAAKSYFDDIIRYKTYSGSELAERPKIAAYTMKWLSKLKPIQLTHFDENTSEFSLQINYHFALHCACSAIDVEVKDLEKIEETGIFEDLLYNMQYRTISGKQYALVFKLIKELTSK